MSVLGLDDDEQAILAMLLQQLADRRPRNQLRQGYMDAKKLPVPPPTVPAYLRNIRFVLGWPAKAVEALARRVRLIGFTIPGVELSRFGLDEILDENEYLAEARLAQASAFEQGVSWLVAGVGGPGEPDALITRQSALDATGVWSVRARRLTSFLSVMERGSDGQPSAYNLYLPGASPSASGVAIVIAASRVQDRIETGVPHIPAEPMVYRQRDTREFGSSRVTRPLMRITDSAVRTILRSEGTADFYSVPLMALFGPDESIFADNTPLRMMLNGIFTVPDNENATEGNERATLTQIQQASQQPHVTQLQVWAQLFAAEASIPVSSLGVGMVQANPTSPEAYIASREDLIAEAEDAQDGFSRAHARILRTAWQIREGETVLPAELRQLAPSWRDARHDSKAATADWFLKVTTALPWVAETDVAVDLIGVDEQTADRLRAEKQLVRGRSEIAALAAARVEKAQASDGTVAV